MAGERFVLLGLARAQARWLTALAQDATSAALPVELVKVLSAEELRARLRSGRAFSAVLVDAGLPACDRDLVELATAQGCAVVVVVDDTTPSRSWLGIGASAVLPAVFGRDELLDILRSVAPPIPRIDGGSLPGAAGLAAADAAGMAGPTGVGGPAGRHAVAGPDGMPPLPRAWRGQVVAVTGAAGTGRSTLTMALAAGLAGDPRDRGRVVLADLSLHAQQGLLHDAGDVVPGLLELVEGHRSGALPPDEVRAGCFELPEDGYDLLLGLRRHRDWTALRAPAFRLALHGLRRAYRVVVADVDGDVEGEVDTGSVDVEDRNMLARVTLREADLVLVAGVAGVAGVHAQLRVLRDVLGLGVPPGRVVPVVNRAPRRPRARAELGRALAELLRPASSAARLGSGPLFVPERRRLDDVVRDGGRLPATVVQPVTSAVRGLLARELPAVADDGVPGPAGSEAVRVVPGSLAAWARADTTPDAAGAGAGTGGEVAG